ncbi:MAG: hypothetical protein KZQ99_08530 [Candidatus Thiodiazotropha sp. (ex Dulcina madagascariensis)]|nr:hypothetical protein [Candidatus Thiodiazotropha sp. (ex Dulcina madagascariensis)]
MDIQRSSQGVQFTSETFTGVLKEAMVDINGKDRWWTMPLSNACGVV